VVAVTALQMLVDHARVQPGQRVLILGAAGAVGALLFSSPGTQART
jgi:NADPH:quinone reductase-like Zn-dependent oxidoreductase